MDKKHHFEDLAKKLFHCLPEPMQKAQHDLEEKFKEILQASFAKLDLVTREEFDSQVKVLERTQDKLKKIEKKIKDLEK